MKRWFGIARHHPLMSIGFALALCAVLFFAAGFMRQAIYWSDPAHHEQPVEGWMTPRYIANSWGVDGHELAKHLGLTERLTERLTEGPKERATLQDIANMRGLPIEAIISIAQDYLTDHKPAQ